MATQPPTPPLEGSASWVSTTAGLRLGPCGLQAVSTAGQNVQLSARQAAGYPNDPRGCNVLAYERRPVRTAVWLDGEPFPTVDSFGPTAVGSSSTQGQFRPGAVLPNQQRARDVRAAVEKGQQCVGVMVAKEDSRELAAWIVLRFGFA